MAGSEVVGAVAGEEEGGADEVEWLMYLRRFLRREASGRGGLDIWSCAEPALTLELLRAANVALVFVAAR